VDTGEWVELVMQQRVGNTFNSSISPQIYGSFVEYHIIANDSLGLITTALNGSSYFNYTVRDTMKPVISGVSHIPVTVTVYDSVVISAQVVDDGSGVDTVLVYFRSDGGSWLTDSMSLVAGDTYEVVLPSFVWGNVVEYYINASDTAGNIAIDDNSDGYY
jgi:hypothetical protein